MKNDHSYVSKENTEQFLRTLVEQSADGMMVIDTEGVVRFANPAAKEMFEAQAPELVGHPLSTLPIDEKGEITLPSVTGQRTIEARVTDITWQGQAAQLAILRDVTERVTIKAELREEQRLLRETNEIARLGGWAMDIETGDVWWSEAARMIHDVPEDYEPKFDDALKFFPLPDREALEKAIAHTRETGEPYDLELPFVTLKGNHLWTRVQGEVEVQNGKVQELRGTIQDITERKKAELALKESESKYQKLFDSAINGFALTAVNRNGDQGPDFIFVDVNQAFEDLFDLKPDAALGKSARKIFPGFEKSLLGAKFIKIADSRVPDQFEYYSDIVEKHFTISAYTPIEGQVAAIFNDITEQKQAEDELRRSENQFRQLFEHDTNGFALTEVVVDETGEIFGFVLREVNKKFQEILRLDRDAVIGKQVVEIIPDLNEPDLAKIIVQVVQSGEPYRFEFFSKKYQRYFHFSAYQPLPNQVALAFNDITDVKKAQMALERSEKKYRTLYETMRLGAIHVKKNLEIHSVNPAAREILGLSKEEIEERKYIDSAWDSITLDGEPLPIEERPSVKALREGERVENFIYGIYNPEKEKHVWINVNVVPQFRKGEKVPYKAFSTFLDITDLIEAERDLRRSEAKFRTLFEEMAQGVVYQNPDGEITSANLAAERILGLSHDQLLGKKSIDEDWQAIRENGQPLPGEQHPAMVALRTGERVENFVFGVKSLKRKETVWIDVSAVPQFRQGEDEPYQVFTTFLDITDQMRIRRMLEERVKELRCISNISTAIQKEPTITEICQIAVKELLLAMQHPELVRAVVELAGEHYEQSSISNGTEKSLVVPIQSHGENIGMVRVCYGEGKDFLLPDEKNLLDSVSERLATYYDRIQSQRALAESEERFRRAFMDAPVPIMIHAEDGEVVTINQTWSDISGYDLQDIPTISDWIEKGSAHRKEEIRKVIQGLYQQEDITDQGKSTINTKHGEKRIWLFSSAPLGRTSDGRRTAISIARDITERERYIDRIVALQEIDQVISATLDLDEVLDRVTKTMQQVVDYDSMSVMLIKDNSLEIIAARGFDNNDEIVGMRFPNKPDFPNYEVIESVHPVTSTRIVEAYPKFTQPLDHKKSEIIKAWLGVPLVSHEAVIGMFAVDRFEANPFTDEDIIIAQQFANRAATAIDNARLYEQTRRQLRQLLLLRKIDGVITSSLSRDQSLPVILRHIQKGLGVDAAEILFYDKEAQELILEKSIGMKSAPQKEITIPLGHGYSGQVAETREPHFIPVVEYEIGQENFPVNFEREEIVSYYGFPLITKGELIGVVNLFTRTKFEPDEEWFDFAETVCRQAVITVDNITLFDNLQLAIDELQQSYDKTIAGWSKALELRDKETQGHSERVLELSIAVARRFGYEEQDLQHLRRGVLLHDIGKMGIPDSILHKPGPLTDEEWVVMRRHPVFAYNMLKDIDYLRPALKIPHYHHERWDGSGYPEGLAGQEIPLEARIFMVVDIYDALTSDRPYRGAWSVKKTIEYLQEQAGKELDPEVVAVFLEIIQEQQVGGVG
jgi:PAS domain S-box-containing protein